MEGFSGGVLEWLCGRDEAELAQARKPRLDLSGTQTPGPGGRAWSASYLSLTRSGTPNPRVNWLNVQSVPALLPPYAAGATRSGLPARLRDEPCFAAAHAIDGRVENAGHGPGFPSWGPDRRDDLWLRLDFGGPARIDWVDLWVRADLPHNSYWQSAVLEFSDGSVLPLAIEESAERQSFTFPERVAEWVRFTRLVPADPARWCALAEAEVWGWRLPVQAAARDGRSVR